MLIRLRFSSNVRGEMHGVCRCGRHGARPGAKGRLPWRAGPLNPLSALIMSQQRKTFGREIASGSIRAAACQLVGKSSDAAGQFARGRCPRPIRGRFGAFEGRFRDCSTWDNSVTDCANSVLATISLKLSVLPKISPDSGVFLVSCVTPHPFDVLANSASGAASGQTAWMLLNGNKLL